MLGPGGAIVGCVGMISGGVLADRQKARIPEGKMFVWLAGMIFYLIASIGFLSAKQVPSVYLWNFAATLFGTMAFAPWIATINDLIHDTARPCHGLRRRLYGEHYGWNCSRTLRNREHQQCAFDKRGRAGRGVASGDALVATANGFRRFRRSLRTASFEKGRNESTYLCARSGRCVVRPI